MYKRQIKRKGGFSLPVLPPDETHLSMRSMSMRGKQQLLQAGATDPQAMQKFNDTFWDAEMMLRRIFDSYGSDRDSEYIIRHYDFEQLKQRRRANYQYLLDHMPEHPQITVIFPVLKEGAVPSHFTVYAKDKMCIRDRSTSPVSRAMVLWDASGITFITSFCVSAGPA